MIFLKKILYYFKHLLDYYFIKRKGVKLERSSYIKRPYLIEGGQYIAIGDNSSVSSYSRLSCFDYYGGERYFPTIEIGNNVFVNRFLTILSANKLQIGNNTYIGSYVSITNENHGIIPDDLCYGLQALTSKEINIGENCWIGDHVTVLPGVNIGNNSIIGAGSVVTHSIPSYCMAVGVPAEVIKKWNKGKQCWESC